MTGPDHARPGAPTTTPILALDFPTPSAALELLARAPAVRWVKVGLQLFTSAGPAFVRELRSAGHHVFLDLKFHDIPNTVAGAVRSAAELGVELLTVHAAGGSAMLRAARTAAGPPGPGTPLLFAVTLLTSLSEAEVAESWGRSSVRVADEVRRLARIASAAGLDGVVASVHEADPLREAQPDLALLTPGIRLAGDAAGDQARVATPEDAARARVAFLVVGRSVTRAADPARAWDRVLDGIIRGGAGVQRSS